ncbi:hypothetical protein DdX_14452 [Ditylenchus destructor]|uniref:Uncharacterized protein n=1 Tax=Ditylenchus destructor TaxID=166010 RepID=A0AAD4MS22_9BILA|nr:hypothetical protein DdX_14452 [Ditylenchus destructor]
MPKQVNESAAVSLINRPTQKCIKEGTTSRTAIIMGTYIHVPSPKLIDFCNPWSQGSDQPISLEIKSLDT